MWNYTFENNEDLCIKTLGDYLLWLKYNINLISCGFYWDYHLAWLITDSLRRDWRLTCHETVSIGLR